MSAVMDDAAVPAFGIGIKFGYDEVRKAWVVLAPERLFLPDEQAVEILRLIDGKRSLGGIVDQLAQRFQAPHVVIAADVTAMLQDLADKGVLRLGAPPP
jgi:pyrroloquinoline quinone biosynthesis protein D